MIQAKPSVHPPLGHSSGGVTVAQAIAPSLLGSEVHAQFVQELKALGGSLSNSYQMVLQMGIPVVAQYLEQTDMNDGSVKLEPHLEEVLILQKLQNVTLLLNEEAM